MAKTLYGQILAEKEYAHYLKDTVVINVDEIASYYWISEKVDWNVANGDFPNLAPPFEDFFCQYAMPIGTEITSEEGKHVLEDPELYGFHFRSKKLDWSDGTKWVVNGEQVDPRVKWLMTFNLYAFSSSISDTVGRDETDFTVGIDEHGVWLPIWGNKDKPMLIDMPGHLLELRDAKFRADYVHAIFSILHPCLLAITFMHTKNTVMVINDAESKTRTAKRYDRKRNEASYKYYTLDIRPLREVLRKEGVEGNSGIAKAAHLRRGHFRSYMEGRGLFGKHHGLFWFDSTFVGNRKDGEIGKDYEIHINKEGKVNGNNLDKGKG